MPQARAFEQGALACGFLQPLQHKGSCESPGELLHSTPRSAVRAFADKINLFPRSIQAWTQSAKSQLFAVPGRCRASRQ